MMATGTEVLITEQNWSRSSAALVRDHTFVTELFSLFAPLFCFSYVDCTQDDDCYISPSTKDMVNKTQKRKKKSDQSTDSNFLKDLKKPTGHKSKQLLQPPQEIEPVFSTLSPSPSPSPREVVLKSLVEEAARKGDVYFGIHEDSSQLFHWELKNQSKGVHVYGGQLDPDDNILVIKSMYSVHSSIDHVLQSLIDESLLLELDTSLDNYEVLYIPSIPNTICRRYSYKSYWPLTPREVVVVSHWRTLPDGRILLSTVSLPNDWCPINESHVRAHVHFSGSLLHAIDEDHTEVTMINHSHLDTNLPASIINSAATSIPISFVSHYRRFLHKQREALQLKIDSAKHK